MLNKILPGIVPALASLLAGCQAISDTPAKFMVKGNAFVAVGDIDSSTKAAFEQALRENPDVRTLILEYVPGSLDDETNLELASLVRSYGFSTIVPENGLVASGGTDLFLAGKTRILEPGACVGVHSWGGDGSLEGRNVPKDDESHKLYLNYYENMEIPESFYWFTLEAAPVDDIHWMTAEEVDRFDLTTSPAPGLGSAEKCDSL